MVNGQAGKGDDRRPCCTSPEEKALREKFFYDENMTEEMFDEVFDELMKQGKIWRK